MHLPNLLTTALLPLLSLAASNPSSSERFTTYHTKQLSTLSPIKLDDTSYADLLKTPRDYAVAILLTALEVKYQCGICREFQPEWDLLGKTWTKGDKEGESRVLFGTLDVKDGQRTFQAVRTASILFAFEAMGLVG